MKKHLISFGSQGYENGLEKLVDSAKECFNTIKTYRPWHITEPFYSDNKKILQQTRGFGYWLWKPYFILQRLNEVADDDLVFYTDALLTINPSLMGNFLGKIDSFFERNVILFHQEHKNSVYTKYDCFYLMSCYDYKYINGKQVNAAFMGFRKNKYAINFVKEWLFWCRQPECITDQPNEFGINFSSFLDHRHDQSILSLLAIKYNIQTCDDISQWGKSPFGTCINHHRTK